MRWETKSLAFRALSAIPFGQELHHIAQRRLTKEWPRPIEHLESYRQRAILICELFEKNSKRSLAEANFVEIGAGRDLALAIALRTLGVAHVTCIDIKRIAKLDLINHAAKVLGAARALQSWDDLTAFGINYLAPASAERTTLPDDNVDCFCTSEVLEHIPSDSLTAILTESLRYLKPGGLHIHAIDYSDHYARSDSAISRFNFLKFSDSEWRKHNSAFQYVNRLRHSDYERLFLESGYSIESSDPHREAIPHDVSANLAERFSRYTQDDLGALRSIIVARKR
ncbi:MAG: class I SAM-dependent methyltransferase [Rhizobiales bacterium]|nr:class I SAM-dependent methyltransferase [Hyphomicrobiales bacterium]